MNILIFYIIFSSTTICTECVKTLRITSIKSCKGDNDAVAEIKVCETDGFYFTFNVQNKVPIKKINVDIKMELMNNDNKVIFKDSLPTFDWCGLFGKNGRVPTSIGWKAVMKGFGKYLKDYMNCPIKKNLTLNRVHGDPKMLLFVPNGKGFFQVFINSFGINGEKVLIDLAIVVEVLDA